MRWVLKNRSLLRFFHAIEIMLGVHLHRLGGVFRYADDIGPAGPFPYSFGCQYSIAAATGRLHTRLLGIGGLRQQIWTADLHRGDGRQSAVR